MKRLGALAALAIALLGGCVAITVRDHSETSIVGAWVVKYDKAPFPFHMQTFNADGTMQQANPDAGNASTSDSDGMGVWTADGGHIRGKWVEVRADRTTHGYIGRGEITFDVTLSGNAFSGMAQANFHDPDGRLIEGPIDTPVSGERVALP